MKKFVENDSAKEFLYSKSFEDYYENEDFTEAFNIFADFLKNDPELFRAYKDNIAVYMQDAFYNCYTTKKNDDEEIDYTQLVREASNIGAEHFLNILIEHRNRKRNRRKKFKMTYD